MEAETSLAIYKAMNWLRANQKRVLAGAIVAAVIAAVVGFYVWNKSQREAEANSALLGQPTGMGATGQAPDAEKLLQIGQEYRGTAAGADAQLLAAKQLFLNGKYNDAEQAFAKFLSDNPGHPLTPQAQVGVAASLESAGKTAEAMQKYKEISAVYSTQPNISLPVKLTLGRLNEDERKYDVAVSFYEELARNDPRDPWVAEARERLTLLVAKHPELDKSGINPYQTTVPTPAPSPLSPTAEDIQLAPPPGTQNSTPAPAPAPAAGTNQTAPVFPPMSSPPPGANPGGNPR
jgi:TolA-binding protein